MFLLFLCLPFKIIFNFYENKFLFLKNSFLLCITNNSKMENNRVNLKKIIEETGVSFDRLARILFPGNEHPKLALNRHLVEKIELKETQLVNLADYLHCSVYDLFDGWKFKEQIGDTLKLENKGLKAELNRNNWILKIFDADYYLKEQIIIDRLSTVSELITILNNFK